MAETVEKPKQITKNDNVIHVRLGDTTSEEVAQFAKDVYGFKNTSEFMRYALDYIMEKKPTLGKLLAPEGVRN